MAKFDLQKNEEILATDFARLYKNSLLAYNIECFITNQRVILLPKTAVDKLTGSTITISLQEINDFSEKQNLQIISFRENSVALAGSGALRIVERLKNIINNEKKILSEKVIYQDDTDVYIRGQLTAKGDVILTNKNITIRSKPGLESLIFSEKSLSCPLMKINNIQFSALDQKLTIQAQNTSISIGGKSATRVHSILRSLEGSTHEDLNDGVHTYTALLLRGAKPSINGELSFTNERVVFTPKSALDTLTGFQLQYFSIAQIQSISLKNTLKIKTYKKNIEFSSSDQKDIFSELYARIIKSPRKSLFQDIRSEHYSEENSFLELKAEGLPFIWQDETPLLIEPVVVKNSEHSFLFANFFMTDQKIRLLNFEKKLLWLSQNEDIQLIQPRKQTSTTFIIKQGNTRLDITPLHQTNLLKFFARKLKESGPDDAEKYAKDNQSIQKILQKTSIIHFSLNQNKILSLMDTTVTQIPKGLRIPGEYIQNFPLKKGHRIEVEIPKSTGRYLFQTIISEQYLSKPDPLGRYYITLAPPKNISVMNNRNNYRAPISLEATGTLFSLPHYDQDRDDIHQYLLQRKKIRTISFCIRDISVGGCGFSHNLPLRIDQKNMYRYIIALEFELDSQKIAAIGIIRHSQPTDQGFISGIEFIKINTLHRSLINRTVLQIEREILQKEND